MKNLVKNLDDKKKERWQVVALLPLSFAFAQIFRGYFTI